MKLTQERLKELMDYSPADGLFVLKSTRGRIKAGAVPGTIESHGYIKIRIDNKGYLAHRLAFLWVTGAFPPDQVDHINRVRTDNRWCNLRAVTQRENARNHPRVDKNPSGHVGVSRGKGDHLWEARISVKRKTHRIGSFKRVEDAAAAYAAALQTLKG